MSREQAPPLAADRLAHVQLLVPRFVEELGSLQDNQEQKYDWFCAWLELGWVSPSWVGGGRSCPGERGPAQWEGPASYLPVPTTPVPQYLVHGCQPRHRLPPAAIGIFPCSQLQLGCALRPWCRVLQGHACGPRGASWRKMTGKQAQMPPALVWWPGWLPILVLV